MRNVTANEFVRNKIVHRALISDGRIFFFFLKPLLVLNMLTRVFSVSEEKCVTHVSAGHEHLLACPDFVVGHALVVVEWLIILKV